MSDRTRWWKVSTQSWGCKIEPMVVTKETEKTVWIETTGWKEGETGFSKELKHTESHQYFHNLSAAKVCATQHCNKRVEYHTRRAAEFERELAEALEVQYD